MRKIIFGDGLNVEGTLKVKELKDMFSTNSLQIYEQDMTLGFKHDSKRKVSNVIVDLVRRKFRLGETILIVGLEYFDEIYTLLKKELAFERYQVCVQENGEVLSNRFTRFTDVKEVLAIEYFDYSHYEMIHHIGDIHACATVLKTYLNGDLNENHLYIFTGDYMERGVEHKETLDLLFDLIDLPNTIFLEGNHEKYLMQYASDLPISYNHFATNYAPLLDELKISKSALRNFCRKLRKFVAYSYQGKKVFVCHGGLTYIPELIGLVPEYQMIRGVGGYDDDVDYIFNMNYKDSDIYMVHGHRNSFENPICNGQSFNLEGSVESGYFLRVMTLSKDGFDTHEIKNDVYDSSKKSNIITNKTPIKEVVETLRDNSLINEKQTIDGVSSFNFGKKVFFDGIWNSQTVKARGLHIATDVEEPFIVARSFEKFFNIGEFEI